jgi:hypothetical protein
MDTITITAEMAPPTAVHFQKSYVEESEEINAAKQLRETVEATGKVKRFWPLEHRYPGMGVSELKDYEGLPQALKQAFFDIVQYRLLRRISVLVEFE